MTRVPHIGKLTFYIAPLTKSGVTPIPWKNQIQARKCSVLVVNEDDRNSFTSKQHTSRDMVRFTRVKVT